MRYVCFSHAALFDSVAERSGNITSIFCVNVILNCYANNELSGRSQMSFFALGCLWAPQSEAGAGR